MERSGHDLRLDYLAFDAWEHDQHDEELSTDDDECQPLEVDDE